MGVKALLWRLVGRPLVSPLKVLGDPKAKANITFTKPGESRTVTIPDKAGVNIATHYEQALRRYSCARMESLVSLINEDNPLAAFHGRQVVLVEGKEQWLDDLRALRQGDKVTITFLPESERKPAAAPPPAVAPGLPTSDGRPTEIMAVPVVAPAELQTPVGLNGKPIDEKNYRELTGVEELLHGDVLPGMKPELGKPETYYTTVEQQTIRSRLSQSEAKTRAVVNSGIFFNPHEAELIVMKTQEECEAILDDLIHQGVLHDVDKIWLMPLFEGRELLTINMDNKSKLFAIRERAHQIAQEVSGDRRIKDKKLETAIRIARMVDEKFSVVVCDGNGGRAQTIGGFIEKGGNCRHRSAALVKALQEVGLRARFAKGFPLGGGRHGWIEYDLNDNGEYKDIYVFDLMLHKQGKAKIINKPKCLNPSFEGDMAYKIPGMAYFREEIGTRVWREIEPKDNGWRAGLTMIGLAVS